MISAKNPVTVVNKLPKFSVGHGDLKNYLQTEMDKEIDYDALKESSDDKWTERDYAAEKFNLVPGLSHYYRDSRGGVKWLEDMLFPKFTTDFINFNFNEVGCKLCEGTTFAIREIFNNFLIKDAINDIAIGLC